MRKINIATSMLALTLLAAPAWAQDTAKTPADAAAAQQGGAARGQVPPAVQSILDQGTDFNGFTTDQLRKRFEVARKLSINPRLAPDVQARLRAIAVAARNALVQQQAGSKDKVQKPRLLAKPAVTDQTRIQPAKPVVRQPTFGSSNPNADTPGDGIAQQPQTEPVAPKPARPAVASDGDVLGAKIMADRRPPDKLSDQELTLRLRQTRQVLGMPNLSSNINVSLRRRLKDDAQALRDRRAVAAGGNSQGGGNRPRNGNKNDTNFSVNINLGPPAVVLTDRRPGDALSTEELQHRIQIYRDIETSNDYRNYRQDERDYWRRTMASDREILRRRLLDERHRREAEIAQEENSGQLNRDIVINIAPQPDNLPDDDVYVAEANDQQIEDVLIAPPRERIQRRYTVDEITTRPELRRSIPRLELDTIHFGFGESIVREEEVRNLDRIGSVIEKILTRYPREVFLIEGHTDAVGSDVSNLYLSRSRAEAVKQALVTYYDIPARNLQTAGLGERFLKIQTPDAEAENRRVSISRVTQFIGEAQ